MAASRQYYTNCCVYGCLNTTVTNQHDAERISYCIVLSTSNTIKSERHDVRKFPKDFLFGTATASYQVEGAWNEDGKAENIWDHLTHTHPESIKDGSNGDIADDSYHHVERDVEMMRELGLDYYRFSLSWARLLPTSFPDKINDAAVQYYNNLIDEMLKYNIEPMITLYHWDLPQRLQEMGGWTNPNMIDWFGDYARIAYELFGDRVKLFLTINEPEIMCHNGYGGPGHAPAVDVGGVSEYLCAKNLLLAHAKAYHIYDEMFRSQQGGIVSIAISAAWFEPESEKEIEAADDYTQFTWQMYTHPIYSTSGDFPPAVKRRVAEKSAEQGILRSRLPAFTPEEVEYIKGTSDVFCLNHYSTYYVYRNESVNGYYDVPSTKDDAGVIQYRPDDWFIGESQSKNYVPWGFYKLLTKLRNDYNNPPIYVTENGHPTRTGLNDDTRVQYFTGYLNALLDAIEEGSDVRRYTAWSLMDNFEWAQGYIERYGLYEVDYEDPKRTRTPRKSAFFYKELLRTRALDMHYEPSADAVMTIDEGH